MTVPEATVVIPTRNRWSMLSGRALPSALAQEDVELEVVVVDEASSDGTAQRLSQLDDPRVRVVRHDQPRLLPGARNVGAQHARGTWLAFLDDDDLWGPSKLRRQIDAADAEGALWAFGRAVVVDASLRILEDDPFPDPAELPSLLLEGNWIPGGGSNVIVRRDAFQQAGRFDEELRFFEDWDLWLRLVALGLPVACDAVVMARVEHGANMAVRDREQVAGAFERMMSKHRPVTGADRRSLGEWLAFEQHRAGRRLAAARLYVSLAARYRSPGNLAAAAGALLGRRGMHTVSRALTIARGASHLDTEHPPVGHRPEWLAAYR
jgi:glycosyltransferase involved in cell wall biosynthesis